MNIQELAQKLLDEGCNPHSYAIAVRGAASDTYCLTQSDGVWSVYYTERGVDQAPFFETADEAEACAFFYQFVMRWRHDHLVGFFRAETAAQALQAILERYGIPSHQDKIPYGGWNDPRYRVFVSGKAVFAARDILGAVPLSDAT